MDPSSASGELRSMYLLTPTYVENIGSMYLKKYTKKTHPHLCGEYFDIIIFFYYITLGKR